MKKNGLYKERKEHCGNNNNDFQRIMLKNTVRLERGISSLTDEEP